MLGAIRKILSRHTGQNEPSVTTSFNAEHTYHDNPNFITNPETVIKLLRQIRAAPPLCAVTLNSSNKTFFTSILDVQEENGLIILDNLSPNIGNKVLLKNKELKLSTCINGVQLSFNLKEVSVENSQDSVLYKARFPEKIYYPQRRSSPRIATDSTLIHFQGTSRDTKTTIGGYVFDFSRNGICVNFYTDRVNIVRGDKLTNCLINLPDGHILSFDLSVCSSKKLNPAKTDGRIF